VSFITRPPPSLTLRVRHCWVFSHLPLSSLLVSRLANVSYSQCSSLLVVAKNCPPRPEKCLLLVCPYQRWSCKAIWVHSIHNCPLTHLVAFSLCAWHYLQQQSRRPDGGGLPVHDAKMLHVSPRMHGRSKKKWKETKFGIVFFFVKLSQWKDHTMFTPLVLSTTGGMGREATTFFKRLTDMIAQKRQHPYPTVMGWLRCRLSFASLRASIICIRGSRSSFHRPIYGSDVTLATYEGRIPSV